MLKTGHQAGSRRIKPINLATGLIEDARQLVLAWGGWTNEQEGVRNSTGLVPMETLTEINLSNATLGGYCVFQLKLS